MSLEIGSYVDRAGKVTGLPSSYLMGFIIRLNTDDLLIDELEDLASPLTLNTRTPPSVPGGYRRLSGLVNLERPPKIVVGPTDTHVPLIGHDAESLGAEIDMDREELKAHLEAQDARVDVRLKSFEQTVKDAMGEIRLNSVESRGELKAMHVELSHLKNIKGTVLAAAGATIIGVGSILAAMLSFGVASFDTGRETSQLVEEAKRQSVETRQLLEQIQTQQRAMTTSPAPSSAPPASSNK